MTNSTNTDEVAQKFFKNYEVESTISCLGSLLTYPQYQENQYRIEQLILYALIYCDGKKKFSHKCLEQIINNRKIFHIHMEDPLEDVFISNINSRYGSFRVFTGLHTNIDYFLQEIMEICEINPSEYEQLTSPIYKLLQLSEKIAEKFNLERWCYGKSSAQTNLKIPKKNKLEMRRKSLYIKDRDLTKLKINSSLLENFTIPSNKPLDICSFHRYPFFKTTQGKLILLNPSAICYSLCLYFVENVTKKNKLTGVHIDLSKIRSRKLLQKELIEKFNAYFSPICLIPSSNKNKIMLDDFVLKFDTNKFCHVVILNEDLNNFKVNNFNTPYSYNEQQVNFINQRIISTSSYLRNSFELCGGLTLVIPCGFSQGIFLELEKPVENNWYICSISIAEFQFFSNDGYNQLLKIWKYLRSNETLLENGVHLINPDKFTNEYAYWVQNEYVLVPSDCEYPASQSSMITLSANTSAVYCIEKRKVQDIHSVKAFKDGSYSKVVRLMQNNIYKKNENLDIYAAEDALESNILLGLVKIAKSGIWLAINAESFSDELRELSYNLWESMLRKISLSSYLFCEELKEGGFDHISIQLFFENPDEWSSTRNINNHDNLFETKVDQTNKKIIIVLKKQLLCELNKPVNIGEKLILQEFIKSLLFLLGKHNVKTDIEDVLNKIFPSEYVRHLHFIRVKDLSFSVAYNSLNKNRKFLLQQEDLAEINLGLANKIGVASFPQTINNPQDCKNVFDNVWRYLFKELQKNIKQYNSSLLIIKLLENIETLYLESRRLKNTSKSIVSEYGKDGLLVSSKEESLRAITSICCRILIEVSLCPVTEDGKEASQSDIDHLMALVSEIYSYANSSDSIHYRLNESSQVKIHANGFISIDSNELISVTNEYLSGYFIDSFEISEKEYNELYNDQLEYSEQKNISDFEEAFINEYQIKLNDFTQIFQALIYYAERKKSAVVSISIESFLEELKDTRVNLEVIKLFVDRFCFKSRTEWESTDKNSNYPWRFQRKLSLSFQPVILIENKLDFNNSKLIYGIQFIENSFRNIFSGIEQGWIDDLMFDSKMMKSLLGTKAEQLGNEFEKHVYSTCLERHWNARHSVNMEFFGAPSHLGDVDVLVWCNHSNKIFALECKRLKMCRTAREIGLLLLKFRGNPSDKKDKLTKHINRVNWLNENIDTVCSKLGITQQIIEIKPLVVTNRLVPMGFVHNTHLSKVEFITLSDISSLI